MRVAFKLESPLKFSNDEKNIIVGLLFIQGKVNKPTMAKLNRCKVLCACTVDDEIVSIGAVKPKTKSVFSPQKASLLGLEDQFQFELGYCFTLPNFRGKGHSSKITELLVDSTRGENLMASTELKFDNSMIRILERNGFILSGKPWKSTIDQGELGLFLRFSK